MFNSVRKDWYTGMRRFNFLEWAQQMFQEFFPERAQGAGQSVNSPGLLVEMNCLLHNIKELFTLGINVANESMIEKHLQSPCWQLKQNASPFCSNSQKSPISIMWYVQWGKKHILSLSWAIH